MKGITGKVGSGNSIVQVDIKHFYIFSCHRNPRHKYGKGMIGADIGTQTVAYSHIQGIIL